MSRSMRAHRRTAVKRTRRTLGPFVINTQAEVRQSIEDYGLGRMSAINS